MSRVPEGPNRLQNHRLCPLRLRRIQPIDRLASIWPRRLSQLPENRCRPSLSGSIPVANRCRKTLIRLYITHLLIRTWPQLLRAGPDGLPEVAIDEAVAAAFLGVRRYRHGVRSMESIVSNSRMSGELHYHRSVLPPHGQLRLQVDEEEFLSLVRGPPRGPSA